MYRFVEDSDDLRGYSSHGRRARLLMKIKWIGGISFTPNLVLEGELYSIFFSITSVATRRHSTSQANINHSRVTRHHGPRQGRARMEGM